MNNDQIIPFGKYKGKHISVLQNDKEYLEWVMSQGWFIEKFQSLHTIIINNFETQNKTPEHNQFQSIFLDDEFIKKIIFKIHGINIDEKIFSIYSEMGSWYESSYLNYNYICKKITNTDKIISVYTDFLEYKTIFEYNIYNYFFDVAIIIEFNNTKSQEEKLSINDFKIKHADTKFITKKLFPDRELKILIELKPIIGDDYSSILRKIPYGSIVITKKYDGSIDFENVRKMFKSKNVDLFLLSEII